MRQSQRCLLMVLYFQLIVCVVLCATHITKVLRLESYIIFFRVKHCDSCLAEEDVTF